MNSSNLKSTNLGKYLNPNHVTTKHKFFIAGGDSSTFTLITSLLTYLPRSLLEKVSIDECSQFSIKISTIDESITMKDIWKLQFFSSKVQVDNTNRDCFTSTVR